MRCGKSSTRWSRTIGYELCEYLEAIDGASDEIELYAPQVARRSFASMTASATVSLDL